MDAGEQATVAQYRSQLQDGRDDLEEQQAQIEQAHSVQNGLT